MSWKETTIQVNGKAQSVLAKAFTLSVYAEENALKVGQQFTMNGKNYKVTEVVNYANRGEVFTITFEGLNNGTKKQTKSESEQG